MIEIKDIKKKIRELLQENDRNYKEVIKKRWDWLYKQLDELGELNDHE